MSALGLAVLNSEPDVVHALLAAGADPRQKDSYGETPLELAEMNDGGEIFLMLKDAATKQATGNTRVRTKIEQR